MLFQIALLYPQYDFISFRKHPIVFYDKDIFTVIDVAFLTEKLSFGLIYTILDIVQESGIDHREYFAHWGKIFEDYVTKLFSELFPDISFLTKRFFPNTFFDIPKKDNEAFDGILEYPNSLVVMEYKGNQIRPTIKYSGDKDLLLNDIDKKFGRKGNDKGVKQLAIKIELLFHRELNQQQKLRDITFPKVNRIYPILIVNEPSLSFGLVSRKLRIWFDAEMDDRKLSNTILIKPLMILPIEIFEKMFPYLAAGDFTIIEFADFYENSLTKEWYQPETSLGNIFDEFVEQGKFTHRNNPKINNKWELLMSNWKKHFKE